jgi:hypothetical protein
MDAAKSNQKKITSSLNKTSRKIFFALSLILIILTLIACGAEFGQQVITKSDESRHTHEANEKNILNSTVHILKDKKIGSNVRIERKKIMSVRIISFMMTGEQNVLSKLKS